MDAKQYPKWVLDQSAFFFDRAHKHWQAALSQVEKITKFYRVAGRSVCLSFAGSSLVDLITPALRHLEVDHLDAPDLTICLWDSVSTHMPPIHFPWCKDALDARGEVIGFNTDQIYTVLDIHTKVLHVLDKKRKLALYWINATADLPWWIGGSPLQLILHWWMSSAGIQLTHAAAIGYPQGGVLLAGKSGSGKSTTSLACMKKGMKYISEDYCLINDKPEIWAHSVYNSVKIGEKTLRFFPELERHVENQKRAPEDKAFLFHHKFQPEKILLGCPLKALITLIIADAEDSRLEPIGTQEVIASLSVSTMWQLTHTGPSVFNHLKRVAEFLPCYRLHLGRDLTQAPELIGGLL